MLDGVLAWLGDLLTASCSGLIFVDTELGGINH